MDGVTAARQAWALWNDDTTSGTVAAVLIVAVVVGPVVVDLWRTDRDDGSAGP